MPSRLPDIRRSPCWSKVPPLLALVAPVPVVVACVVWAIDLRGDHEDFSHATAQLHAVAVARQAAGAIDSVWSAPPEADPQGFLRNLADAGTIQGCWGDLRASYAGDTAAAGWVAELRHQFPEAFAQAREALLRRIQRGLTQRSEGSSGRTPALAPHQAGADEAWTADQVRLRREAGEVRSRLDALERLSTSRLDQTAGSGRRFDLLCAAAGLLVLYLFAALHRTRRLRDRHLHGARLVEDMLESYSRRLESMNAELEQASLLKTQFLANTSHELLTPLNGVIGSLDLLREDPDTSPAERRELLEQASTSAEALHGLIRDLLDLCKLEEGNLSLRCRSLELGPIIGRATGRHRTTIQQKGLALLVTAPSGGWPRIHADAQRTEQVLQHLLSNALKFTPEGSIRITGRPEGNQVRIEIADTGVGIAKEKLPRVFELFSQADGSQTRRFGGTGMGLTLCRHLVRGMAGQIGIESEGPGRGTRVWFTLPLDSAAASQTKEAA